MGRTGTKMSETVLIVDDDPVQLRLLEAAVTRAGHQTLLAKSGEAALALLDEQVQAPISVIVLDLLMPGLDGLGVLGALKQRQFAIPVIVQTAQGGIETVVGAMRAGAFDFVVKPVSPDRLKSAIANALKLGAHSSQTKRKPKPARNGLTFHDIVSASPRMEKVLRIGDRAARSQIPVLIEGESGVGKELIARAIQGSSDRRDRPFVTVNCGALPENLVESILFGHEKGAFTGASDKHVGKFEEANGGTLFLDEIGELPLDIQVKLLRAVQESEIDPVGSRKPVKVDIRLISATNRNLLDEVKSGRFREDLYYRLNVLPLTVPPLRDRAEDIPVLARHFVKRFAKEENRPAITGISPHAESMLCAYDWPGNIRQLENAIFRAVVLAEGDLLTGEEFPQIAAQLDGFSLANPELTASAPPMIPAHDADSMIGVAQATRGSSTVNEMLSGSFGCLRLVAENGQVRGLEDVEAEVIRFAIAVYNGRMSEVARRLGIGRSTLYRKLKDYGLEEAVESAKD